MFRSSLFAATVLTLAVNAQAALINQYFTGTNSTSGLTLTSPAVMSNTTALPDSSTGFSLNNTGSGWGAAGGAAESSTIYTALDNKAALTLAGWYKPNGTPVGNSRLLDRAADSVGTGDWSLFFEDTGKLQFKIGGTSLSSSPSIFYGTGWVFFAATFQGGSAYNIYVGSPTAAVTNVGNRTTSIPADLGSNSRPLTIGNRDSLSRASSANFFDIRVYDDVQTLGQLEDIRASAIPEPATMGLALGALTLLMGRRVRKA